MRDEFDRTGITVAMVQHVAGAWNRALLAGEAEAARCDELLAVAKAATLFLHNLHYEAPVEVHKWEWSDTFGKWSALVTFADGWHGWTYPKPEPTGGLLGYTADELQEFRDDAEIWGEGKHEQR